MARFATASFARWGPRLALLGALGGCVEPYAPEIIDAPNSFLVVDGFINGNGRTRIQLTRTLNVAATTAPPVEKGAKLFILDDAGTRYPLTEKTAGAYQSDSLLLSPARQYQLRITTTAGNAVYESARVALKATPPIDQLGWRVQDEQVRLLLSTHDPAQATRYYRWGVAETWEFNAAFQSYLEYDRVKDDIVDRTTPIYTCWHTNRLSAIKQGSSAQLSQDALADVELLHFPRQDERFKIRYSLLVSQYAETAEEFAYYELLRKNTEAVGTVNDPLPVQLTGNVRRVDNAQEPVLGYVGAHTVQQKRIFITRAELPFVDFYQYDTPYKNCVVDTLKGAANDPNVVPISRTRNPDGILAGSRNCVDCRQRGSNVKPSFW
ncbi:DUF4249 domain-containing protein [Hymenobacter coccineus]|uniref:DUF4249 domain-containing protein n=1 Tax=Hymenobacter coccineus TaxID=1908235 RepID=A0A1G1TI95_9BACT|nr:DUF4249 domain-containing protein [Hymenobacter coccineus]OGX90599.1 hypothetical protein BEN49_22270 [Hymenobacter coccineus]